MFSGRSNPDLIAPAVIGDDGLAAMLGFMGEANRHAVRSLMDIPGIGLACLILRNDLDVATGAMFNLDGYGPTRNAGRKSAVTEFGRISGFPSSTAAILDIAVATRKDMSLARLPVHCLASQFEGDRIEEIKSYIRADRCNESIENGRVVADRPLTAQEFRPILRSCFAWHRNDKLETAKSVIDRMMDRGALLEMIGVDDHTNAGADVKLYFSSIPAEGRSGFDADVAIDAVGAALATCGFEDDISDVSNYVRSMMGTGLPCNLIAVGFRDDGCMETKIYFDAWDTAVERAPIHVCYSAAGEAIAKTYESAGIEVADGAVKRLLDRMAAAELSVDTVSLDVLSGRRGAKVYVRSKLDVGFGVRPGGTS